MTPEVGPVRGTDVPSGRTAVVIVNYGVAHLIERNIAPLRADRPDLDIVVVDNLRDDAERERMEAVAARLGLHLVRADENLGFGAGMNLGVAAARRVGATRFILLNPDAAISASAVETIAEHLDAEPSTLVSPHVVHPDGSDYFAGADLYLADGRIRSRRRRIDAGPVEPWLSGAALGVTAELWDRVGGFSPEYFLYWEDVDLSVRVRRAGGRLAILDHVRVVHDEGGSHERVRSSRAKSTTYDYYMVRNRLLFAAEHLGDADRRRWSASAPRVAYEILLHGGRRQFLTDPVAVVGAAVRGVRDGRRLLRNGAAR